MGLLSMDDVHSYGNRILLCPTCDAGHTDAVPAWIFLPVDLDSFLTTEEEFQRDRKDAANEGRIITRQLPNMSPDTEYARYQIRDEWIHPHAFLKRSKPWAGSPITTIVHSAPVTVKHLRLPREKYGIPDDVSETLQRLLHLYGTPAPEITQPDTTQSPEVSEFPDSDSGDDNHSIRSSRTVNSIACSRRSFSMMPGDNGTLLDSTPGSPETEGLDFLQSAKTRKREDDEESVLEEESMIQTRARKRRSLTRAR